MSLTGKQRRHLRALGHHLDPVVQLGKGGLTEGVTSAVGDALEQHELIKIRLGTECPDARDDVASALAESLKAEVAQTMGRTILMYRRHPKQPKIVLPGAKGRGEKGQAEKGQAEKGRAKKGAPPPAEEEAPSSEA